MPLEFYHCALMAEALAAVGRKRDALDIVAKTLERAASQVGLYVPELWRLKGELTLALSPTDRAEAERSLEHAAAMAGRQGARLLELRAIRFWRSSGRQRTARRRARPARAALSRLR